MNGMQRLAQAERDCVDLHNALWSAIRQLMALRGTTAGIEDLLEVLHRTSHPETPAARLAQLERARQGETPFTFDRHVSSAQTASVAQEAPRP